MKAERDVEWLAGKHDLSKPRDWHKVHRGIDAETLEIRAIEVTGSRIGDAPVLPDLLEQIPGDQPPGMVTADGAHGMRACHAIAAREAAAVTGRDMVSFMADRIEAANDAEVQRLAAKDD